MKDYILEVCVDSVESALAAERGGATRLELCANLVIGGTTPGYPLFEQVKKETGLPVRTLIRPRFGDFLYTQYEHRQMLQDIRHFAQAGADGVVIGSLNADGTLDTNAEASVTVKMLQNFEQYAGTLSKARPTYKNESRTNAYVWNKNSFTIEHTTWRNERIFAYSFLIFRQGSNKCNSCISYISCM